MRISGTEPSSVILIKLIIKIIWKANKTDNQENLKGYLYSIKRSLHHTFLPTVTSNFVSMQNVTVLLFRHMS